MNARRSIRIRQVMAAMNREMSSGSGESATIQPINQPLISDSGNTAVSRQRSREGDPGNESRSGQRKMTDNDRAGESTTPDESAVDYSRWADMVGYFFL